MRVLALDLATVTGWASVEMGGEPTSGAHRFASPGADQALLFGNALVFFKDAITVHRPDRVVFEAPLGIAMVGRSNRQTLEITMGLPAILMAVCNRMQVQVRQASLSEVRSHFIGTTRLKSAEAKKAVQDRCRLLGWSFVDDNAADALALLDYQVALFRKQRTEARAS